MKKILVLSLLLLTLIIAGCSPGTGKADLVIAVPQDPDFLDPHKAEAAGTQEMMNNVFEGLMKASVEGMPVEAIASDYTISDDALVYTFTLRDGVKFHNGEDVTVDDVIWSYTRAGSDHPGIQTQEALVGVTIEAVGENQIRFTLPEPNGAFLEAMTAAVIDSSAVEGMELEAADEVINREPIGTGPYRFVSYNPTQNILLERFEDYWDSDKAGRLETVEFRLFADNSAALSSLLAEEVDLLPRITIDQIASLPESYEVFEGQQNLIQILGLNHDFGPFAKQAVREAINYAIDKDALIDRVADGKGTKLGSNMSPVMDYWFEDGLADLYPHDIEKAKQLLEEAGETGLSFTISIPSNYDHHIKTGEVLVEQLAQAGITANIELVEWLVWMDRIYFGEDYEATIIAFDGKLDPHPVMHRYMSDYPQNFLNYSNPEYDKLMIEGLTSIDQAKRAEAYKAGQRIIAEDSGVIFLMDPSLLIAHKKTLKGYTLYPVYFQDVAPLYFEEPGA